MAKPVFEEFHYRDTNFDFLDANTRTGRPTRSNSLSRPTKSADQHSSRGGRQGQTSGSATM